MTTYKQVIAEINQLLDSYDIHPECSDIVSQILLMDAFGLTVNDRNHLRGKVSLVPDPRNENKLIFHLRHVTNNEYEQFAKFVSTRCQKEHEENKLHRNLIVDAESVYQNLIPFLKQSMDELKKHYPDSIEDHVRQSTSHPDFIKKAFRREQKMDQEGNLYGKMMKEIAHNLRQFHISIYYTNIISNTLMHMADIHKSQPAGIEGVKFPVDFMPARNGEEIVFHYYRENDPKERMAHLFSLKAPLTIERTPPNRRSIRMETRDFYLHIMPLFRASILEMIKNPTPVMYRDYKALSVKDPSIIEIENDPVDTRNAVWTPDDTIVFPPPAPRPGFFCRTLKSAANTVGHTLGCIKTEKMGPRHS